MLFLMVVGYALVKFKQGIIHGGLIFQLNTLQVGM